MRRKLIAANWKMNKTIAEARSFADALRGRAGEVAGVDLLVAPPFFSVPAVAEILSGTAVDVGVQDVYHESEGAFTGEVSTAMVADAGATAVIVGHSERRHVLGENDTLIARKFGAVLAAGLAAILCVGETLEERDAGRAESVVAAQIDAAFEGHSAPEVVRAGVAYEPVWAIGTGRTATPDDAEAMHAFIRGRLAGRYGAETAAGIRILYGGSVKPANAGPLLSRDEIDGALVGGAGLEVDSFLDIARAAPAA